jgi:hypothetical protein
MPLLMLEIVFKWDTSTSLGGMENFVIIFTNGLHLGQQM